MKEALRTDEADGDAARVGREPEPIMTELVTHLRHHRTPLRQAWTTRIHDSHLLEAMSPQERDRETTSVYDDYVQVLETGSVEALQQFARELSERLIRRGAETKEVLGVVLLLHEVFARSLLKKYQPDLSSLNRVLDAYEPVANAIATAVAFNFVDERAQDPSASEVGPGGVNDGAARSLATMDSARQRRLGEPLGTTSEPTAPDTATALQIAQVEIATLNQALRTRTTIGEAIGLLMHERTISADTAFAHLVEVSSHANIKVRKIAALMVDEANARAEHTGSVCSLQSRRVADE